MKKTLLATAISSVLSINSAAAMSVEERLAAMEQRISQLENKVETQQQVIDEKEREIDELKTAQSESGNQDGAGGWFQSVSMGGVIEVEANRSKTDGAGTSSDLYVATAELGISAQVNDWTSADMVLLYEDGEDFVVDTAIITIADPNSFWAVTAGKTVVPFGTYESYLLSDPLTLELGETGEDTVIAGFDYQGFNGGAYLYKGDIDSNDNDEIGSYGGWLGYARESDNLNYAATVGYTNNLGDSDTLGELTAATGMNNHVAAWHASLGMNFNNLSLIGEYVGASDSFAANEIAPGSVKAKPSAYHLEGAYHFKLSDMDSTFAIGYGETDESADIGLAEKRIMTALSIGIMENTSVSFEYASEEDYAGVDTDTVTGQLAVEF